MVTGLRANAVGKRQGSGAKKVDMHIARAQELAVFEVVIFEVFQAVAHVGFAAEKLALPQHLAIAHDAAAASQMLRQLANPQFRAE